jgi:hypothetical protein
MFTYSLLCAVFLLAVNPGPPSILSAVTGALMH